MLALGPPATHAETLGVLTYNVRGLPTVLAGDRSGEMAAIAQAVERLRSPNSFHEGASTIVALQEVFTESYHRSLLEFAAPSFPFATAKDSGGTFGLGDGLLLLSQAPFTRHFRVRWNKCFGRFGMYLSDCDTDKGFLYARHEIAPGAFVDVYNLHTDAGRDSRSNGARRDNVRQLLAVMESLSPPGTAVIVLGDTNSRYTRALRDIDQLLTAGGLRDVWLELLRSGRIPAEGPSLKEACSRAPSGADCELVDKIFYRSGSTVTLLPTKYEVLASFRNRRGRELSDHLPVAARFDVEIAKPAIVAGQLARAEK